MHMHVWAPSWSYPANPIVGIATADSGIQPVARSPRFARTQLALRQGSCAEVGGLFV